MLSAVAASAQVALQASTIGSKDNKSSEKETESSVVKRKRDTVTISPEAVQLTQAALNSTEKSHDEPPQDEKAAENK